VVGSSLGGYYSTYLAEKFDLKATLVNPAVVAHLSLKDFVGPQRWLYSGESFEFTLEHIEELRAIEIPVLAKPQRFWLLVEEGDETLDYRHAVDRYAGARQTVLPGGDHSFTRWNDYLDPIVEFAGLA
ncbi:MAG: YqiA/YcfP family alpha/beta fold hydrolase, partial [Sulfuritalea sp.]|nr:YqiA/YcfP family alpha/beta fold hydrolase [Sulfuritalea sp.]